MSLTSSMYIGVSGMQGFSTAIQVVSDNVANADTTGYKANSVVFGDLVSGALVSSSSQSTDAQGLGSRVMDLSTDYSVGSLEGTSSWSDVALSGSGFFTVSNASTAADVGTATTYYTRDGYFSVDNEGYLVNSSGYYVLDQNGSAIQVDDPTSATWPNYKSYEIDADGQIWGVDTNGDSVAVPAADTYLGVALFPNEDALVRQGSNLYLPSSQSGDAVVSYAGEDGRGTLMSMTLESSNVDLASEMVDMIVYQADYNANTKTISISSELIENTINMVR